MRADRRGVGADKRGFAWTDIKEKYGTARLFWTADDGCDAQTVARIEDAVATAEALSETVCMVCGAPGVLGLDRIGWWRTLCPEHGGGTGACVKCGKPGKKHGLFGYWLTLCPAHAHGAGEEHA